MNLLRAKYARLAAAILLVLAWSVLKDTGADVTSGTPAASPEFKQIGNELVTTSAAPGNPAITQSLTLEANHDYVVRFEAASSREAHIVAGFASGPTFTAGKSFSLDLDERGGPIKVRRILNSGPAPQGLQLKIACSGAKVLIRRISVRTRSLPATLAAWFALASALLIAAAEAFHSARDSALRPRMPQTVSWAWALIAVISSGCILRNLAFPRPFVFGDELLYAALSKFAGRETLLIGNQLTPVIPNSLYFCLYRQVFRFDDNYLEAAKVLNVFFFAVGLAALYATIRLFQPRKTALVALAIIALGGINICSIAFMPEAMYFCLFSLLVYFLVRYIYMRPLLASTLCGLCLAAEILVKPHGLILIAPWLIAITLLKLPWRKTVSMALCFIFAVALGNVALNLALTGEPALGLGAAYGPLAARSVSAGSFWRIAGLMGAHFAALSSLYGLPILVAVCYVLQRRLEFTEKSLRLNAMVLLTLSCLITLLFTTSKFLTLWSPGSAESRTLLERYYIFVLPWLVASFFCAYPELDWSRRRHRRLFLAGGVGMGLLALFSTVMSGASHSTDFIDFPDIFWFYVQPTSSRYFVAALMAVTMILYLVRRPASGFYALSLGLLAATGSIWTWRYLLTLPATPGDVASAVFRPLIRPEALDRGLLLVSNGSDLDSYRLMFHLLGAYDVAVQDPTRPVLDSAVEDRPWIMVAGPRPVKFYYQQSVSIGRYTLYLLPEGASGQYSAAEGPTGQPVEEILKDPKPFVVIDILGRGLTANPVVPADTPLRISGWAIDPKRACTAGEVAIVIDERTYPATYGQDRPDVAGAFQNPGLVSSGYMAEIPRDAVGKGVHDVFVRVIARNRRVYWTGAPIKFTAE